MRELLLFIHIVAIGAWLGSATLQLVANPAMQRAGGATAASWMRQTARIGRVVVSPAAVITLITGVILVLREDVFDFEQVFVTIGFLVVVVGAVLGMRVSGPGGRKAADLHEQGDEKGAAAVESRLRRWGLIELALLLFAIYAMVDKLGI